MYPEAVPRGMHVAFGQMAPPSSLSWDKPGRP